jgi:hypothetical protein
VRESKKEGEQTVADPTAFTAVTVKHSGAEDAFAAPANGAAKLYLDAAAKAFFGDGAFPAPVTLVFDPVGAKAAVSTKGGNNAGEPKKKPELVKALLALPRLRRQGSRAQQEEGWRAEEASGRKSSRRAVMRLSRARRRPMPRRARRATTTRSPDASRDPRSVPRRILRP